MIQPGRHNWSRYCALKKLLVLYKEPMMLFMGRNKLLVHCVGFFILFSLVLLNVVLQALVVCAGLSTFGNLINPSAPSMFSPRVVDGCRETGALNAPCLMCHASLA